MKHLQPHWVTQRLTNTTYLSAALMLLGAVGLYISTIIRNPYTVLYPSVLFISAIGFLLLRNRRETAEITLSGGSRKPVLIGIFAVFTLLIVQYYEAEFWRTNVVFYLTFALYVLVGLYIVSGGRTAIALLLVFFVGLTTRITALYSSREYIGVDIYGLSSQIESIVEEGGMEILATSKYFYAPFYHIQAAQGQLLFDVGTKEALTLTTMLSVVVVPALVIYIVTNRLWSRQIALLASLLYTGADEAINWGVHLIPTSLGIAFFSISLLSVLLYYLGDDTRMFVVFAGSIAALTLTHQISLFISAVLVITFSLAIVLYTFSLPRKTVYISLFTGFAVQLDFMVTGYQGPSGGDTFFQRILGTFIASLLTAETDSRSGVPFPTDSAISLGGASAMADIQLVGSSLLLLFAILGALFWLHESDEPDSVFVALSLGVGASILLILTLVFPLIGMRNLIPSRWWPFTYILLAIFAAPGLVFLIKSVGFMLPYSDKAVPFLLIAFLLPYVVLMGGAAVASSDNPFFDEGFSATRYSITDTEQALGEHTNKYDSESVRIASDAQYPYTSSIVHMDYRNPQSIASEDPILIANRGYMSEKQAMYIVRLEQGSVTVHGGVPISQLKPSYRSTVYDTGGDELLWVHAR